MSTTTFAPAPSLPIFCAESTSSDSTSHSRALSSDMTRKGTETLSGDGATVLQRCYLPPNAPLGGHIYKVWQREDGPRERDETLQAAQGATQPSLPSNPSETPHLAQHETESDLGDGTIVTKRWCYTPAGSTTHGYEVWPRSA